MTGPVPRRWQFTLAGVDISCGLFLNTKMGERQQAGEVVEVLPLGCYKAHVAPEDGSLACLKAGVCKYGQETVALGAGGWGLESYCASGFYQVGAPGSSRPRVEPALGSRARRWLPGLGPGTRIHTMEGEVLGGAPRVNGCPSMQMS